MTTRDTHSKEETQNCPCPLTQWHAVRSGHPSFLLRHCGPYWQRYEYFCESFFTILGRKHTVTELCHYQAWCCSPCQASC